MNTPLPMPSGWELPEPPVPPALPLSPKLPPLPPNPRVLLLIDGDCASRSLVEGTPRNRACDHEVRACLNRVHATAALVDPRYRTRLALSSATAIYHFAVLASAPNNSFTVRYGLHGADMALIEELRELMRIRSAAARRARMRSPWLADLVILVGHDGIYAPPVRDLRLAGTPSWLLAPGYWPAAKLRKVACAADYIGPRRPPTWAA